MTALAAQLRLFARARDGILHLTDGGGRLERDAHHDVLAVRDA